MASRHTVPIELRLAHLYLITSVDEAQLKGKREALRKELMPLLQCLEPDEDGNFFYEFPEGIFLDDTLYSGIQAQRRVSEYVNDETAEQIIDKYQLRDRCIKTVVTEEIDYDELYACNQEGIITDEDIDSILETSETFALIKVKK